MENIFAMLAFGFVLGIKHAMEPDHMIAVSAIASQNKNIWRSGLTGLVWGIGHTFTLFVVGFIVLVTKMQISEKWSMTMEFAVGIMLVALGIAAFLRFRKKEKGMPKESGLFLRSLFVGFVHGLAGSAAMVVLSLSTAQTIWQAELYIFIFGLGTVVGMLTFTIFLGLPFLFTGRRYYLQHVVSNLAATFSISYGFYYMYKLGITEGLFKLWTG